jgi:hypothetical protein
MRIAALTVPGRPYPLGDQLQCPCDSVAFGAIVRDDSSSNAMVVERTPRWH